MRDVTSEFFRRTGDIHPLHPLPSSLAARIANRIATIERERGPDAAIKALDDFIEMLGLLESEHAVHGPRN